MCILKVDVEVLLSLTIPDCIFIMNGFMKEKSNVQRIVDFLLYQFIAVEFVTDQQQIKNICFIPT